MRRWRVVVAVGAALAPGAAVAFDGFGLWPEADTPIAASAHALPYKLKFTLPQGSGVSLATLRGASSLYSLRKDPPPDGFSLALRARRDFAPLVDALWSQGYYDAQVAIRVDGVALPMGSGDFTAFQRAADSYRGRAAAPVEIVVSPGRQFVLRRFAVLGGDGRPLADLPERIVALRPGDAAAADAIRGAEARIVDFYRSRSRPLARIAKVAPVVDHPAHAMDLTLVVDPGPVAAIGPIKLSGPKSFDPLIARSFLYLKPGDPYSPAALSDARQDMRQLPAVGAVRIKEADKLDAQGQLPLSVDVGDRPAHALGIEAQYSTIDGPAIQTYWENRNLFGGAEYLRLEANVSYNPANTGPAENLFGLSDRNIGGRVAAHFMKPAIDGGPDDLLADVTAERATTNTFGFQGYTANDGDADIALRRRFSRQLSAQIGLDAQAGDATDAIKTVTYNIVGVTGSASYDSTNDRLDPTQGVRARAAVAAYPGIFGSLYLYTAKTEVSAYQALDADARFVLAGRARVASEIGPGLEDIPANLRLYAGGGGSVRGYAYSSLGPRTPSGAIQGGRSAVDSSVELRWRATDAIGLVGFFDAGNAFEAEVPNFSLPLQMSAGVGLRYYTGFGPLRLDIAAPLNPRPGDPRFAIYASIGQAF
ncbi:MAG TPA: BamA/TamA family outer membrane protein [Roseiarcus sp.]|nr:BamA/TamA family outer membrane protein [Roseiarcus sp.]